VPLGLWFSALAIIGAGFLKRADPEWQKAAPRLAMMALLQVALGLLVGIVTMPN